MTISKYQALLLLICFILIGCPSGRKDAIISPEDKPSVTNISIHDYQMLRATKRLLKMHEDDIRKNDLDGILSNFADDAVGVSSYTQFSQGKEPFRELYEMMLSKGSWDFVHTYHGYEIHGNLVIAYGVAEGTLVDHSGKRSDITSNFLIIFKQQKDKSMKFWRVAFGPNNLVVQEEIPQFDY